jgi:hypothetical protein
MTWSLKLQNGDLALGGKGFQKATDDEKLIQDLRCHLLQKMGENDLHPTFGSLLDGGVMPDGQLKQSLIGMNDQNLAASLIQIEIQRILSNYQDAQLARAKQDKIHYGKATLTKKEVLFAINSIQVTANMDNLYVLISLTTGTSGAKILEMTLQ